MTNGYKLLIIATLLLYNCNANHDIEGTRLVPVASGWSQTSVNTTVFRRNSLTTSGEHQYIAYWDDEGYLTLGKRESNSDQWQLERQPYRGYCADAHRSISIEADGHGYLHVAFDHHGTPLTYAKTTTPGSLELDELKPMTGENEQNVTYPEFYRLDNGDLLFAYRTGGSGRGNMALNYYMTSYNQWTTLHTALLDGQGQRNAYWQMCLGGGDTLHLSWVWRETSKAESNHDICYAMSPDGGISWQNSHGVPYSTPITIENAEIAWPVPQGSDLINQTDMAADHNGHPYIATYWRETGDSTPQYRLVWHNGQKWQHTAVAQRKTPFTLQGKGSRRLPLARPRIVLDNNEIEEKVIALLIRDQERGNRMSIAHTTDPTSGNWTITDLTSFSLGAWEPSFDAVLWRKEKKLNIFVQQTTQANGDVVQTTDSKTIYVMELPQEIIRKQQINNTH